MEFILILESKIVEQFESIIHWNIREICIAIHLNWEMNLLSLSCHHQQKTYKNWMQNSLCIWKLELSTQLESENKLKELSASSLSKMGPLWLNTPVINKNFHANCTHKIQITFIKNYYSFQPKIHIILPTFKSSQTKL